MPPLPEGENSRRNLYLKTKDGAITAEVDVIPRAAASDSQDRVSIEAITYDGSVKLSLVSIMQCPLLL